MNCSSIPDYTHTLDLVVALGGIPSAFFFLFPTDYPVNYQSAKSKVMNNKKKNEGQTDFSYYGLYLLDYLRTNKFEQADDTAFIRERADRAAETYERARLEGYPADGAQELAMDTLLRGLHYSRYAILREVVENEFADEVPEEKREAFVLKLLPLVGNVFSVYDLSDDNFALSSDYDPDDRSFLLKPYRSSIPDFAAPRSEPPRFLWLPQIPDRDNHHRGSAIQTYSKPARNAFRASLCWLCQVLWMSVPHTAFPDRADRRFEVLRSWPVFPRADAARQLLPPDGPALPAVLPARVSPALQPAVQ